MSDQLDSLPSELDAEFERLGRRAGAELRMPPPDDGAGSIHLTARRRRVASMSATVAVVLAVVVGGLIVVDRYRHVDENRPVTVTPSPTFPSRVELRGHTDLVEAIDISADGRLVVTAGDTTVRIWDSFTGRELRKITANTASSIIAVAFSADGRVVGAHHSDGHAEFWGVADGHAAASFRVAWDEPRYSPTDSGIVLSPDGKTKVKLGRFTGAALFDATTGVRLHLLGSGGIAYAGTFSRDGAIVAVRFDTSVRLWRVAPFEELPAVNVPAHQATPERIKVSPDGTRVAFTVEFNVIIQRVGATP